MFRSLLVIPFAACLPLPASAADSLSAADYASIQEAIDANPGKPIFVPAGDHVIIRKIRLGSNGSGMHGPGRIVQTEASQPIIEIERASGVSLRDVTLTRADGAQETRAEGVLAIDCRDLVLDGVRVIANRTRSAAIAIRSCRDTVIRDCLVRDYMSISIDDRTASPHYGYAFHCIDGSGIAVTDSQATLIKGNRVVEETLLPTREVQEKFRLGMFAKKNPERGALIDPATWEKEQVTNWHQGSAIVVTSPESSDFTQILGNQIENAAQGIDLHADHVIVSQNIVNNAFIGMKAMHGSRHVLILGNQFSRNDLWSIGLMPGAASHPAGAGIAPNVDGGSIIANNIISEFGYGHAHWIWGGAGTPIRFDQGQMPDDPPLRDVIVQGNVVYDTGRDDEPASGPRYRYAVRLSPGDQGLHFTNNILHPGTEGVSNRPLPP